MCCKLLGIEELQKPPGVWCKHVAHGKGCGAYDERPGSCRSFNCYWLVSPYLGPEWKPDKSKFVIWQEPSGAWILSVDPGNPHAWRQPQYIRQLRLVSAQLAEEGQVLILFKGEKMICILPDRDVELPRFREGEAITVTTQMIGARTHYEVVIIEGAQQG
jgi:hypothetical protein